MQLNCIEEIRQSTQYSSLCPWVVFEDYHEREHLRKIVNRKTAQTICKSLSKSLQQKQVSTIKVRQEKLRSLLDNRGVKKNKGKQNSKQPQIRQFKQNEPTQKALIKISVYKMARTRKHASHHIYNKFPYSNSKHQNLSRCEKSNNSETSMIKLPKIQICWL